LVPHKEDGEKVRIAEFASAEEEARWIAMEIDRLHRAGQRWRAFAALYRIHSHRDALVEALEEQDIPFVIRNLSIMNHSLVRDVVAYVRLLANPSDNIACARVLSAPAWGLDPAGLLRLCERAGKGKKSLWDTLQAAQGELAFAREGLRTDELVAGLSELRRKERRIPALELFDELSEWLALSLVTRPADRPYLDRLRQFVREWQPKSETSRLREFAEYLEYFEQAGGKIDLEQEGGDAVQLMTVHAAKGLEFDHVFVLRLAQRAFPMAPRPSVLEFPAALMKEELPQGDYHTHEERRLFYVAITRARDRLTLTTVVHKRSKPSLFLDDILSSPSLALQNIEQLTPKLPPAAPSVAPESASPLFDLTIGKPRVYSQIGQWALAYRPPVFEPLQLSASAIDTYNTCPQKYLFGKVWGIPGGPAAATTFGNVMHTTIRQFVGILRKGQKPPFEEVETIFRREWTSAGFEDEYQEELYKHDGMEQLRAFYESAVATPPDVFAQEKGFTLDLEHGVQVTGRLDQINRLEPGQAEIIDYKTGKPKAESDAQKDLQLGIYALAAREVLGLEPTRLVYYNLRTNQCVAGTRTEKQLNEVLGTIQEVAADIRAREFPANPGFFCRTCDFRFLCPEVEPRRPRVSTEEPEGQGAASPAA
jgi:DNA helicase-2/ATP-dependent DNA helicase PcrA